MLENSWCFYEARTPRRRIFHPKKRSLAASLCSIAAAIAVIFVVANHF